MVENENYQSQNPKKYRIIKPSFYIDDERRVICESHSQIERIRVLSSLSNFPAFEETMQLEKILTCKTCKHYQKDVCYFSKEDIDKIEEDRLSFLYNCNLCGQSIDRPFTIMHSLYNKNKFKVDIPTICCTCFSSLENESYLEESRQRMIRIFIKLLLFTLLLFAAVMSIRQIIIILQNVFAGIVFFGIVAAMLSYLIFHDSRNIMFLMRGRKYYKITYGKAKERKEGEYIDDYPFD